MRQRTYGYLRVSTETQNTSKNRGAVAEFARLRGWPAPHFVEETASGAKDWHRRKIGQLVERMRKGDVLITPELSRLGRSVVQVLEVLDLLSAKGIECWSVKEASLLNGNGISSLVSRTILSLLAQIERELIRERTREGLQNAKAKGAVLGRPKGRGASKLDKYRQEIRQAYFQRHERIASLSRQYGCSQCCMRTYLAHEKKLQKIA